MHKTEANTEQQPGTGISDASQEFQTRHVATVSLAHALNHTYSSFLAPLLPALIAKLALSNTQAGLLAFLQSSPSLLQPVIGHLADRVDLRYFVVLTPAVAATTMSLLGVAPHYAALALLITVAGLSSATFHAAAPAMAGRLSGWRLGRGLGFWIVGGYLGFAVGPILVAGTVKTLGLQGTPWLLIGGWVGSAVLYLRLRGVRLEPTASAANSSWRHGMENLRPILVPVVGIIVARALCFSATLTFLPILLTEQGIDLWLAGIALSLVQVVSAVGALIAGSASDRLGRRTIVSFSMCTAPLLVLALVSLRGWVQVPVLIGLGLTMPATHVVLMALMQECCPDNRALATGVLLSVTFISESIGAVLLGTLADLFSLNLAFGVSAVVLLAGVPFVLLLPKETPVPSTGPSSA